MQLQEHWQHIYQTKQPHEVSWTQDLPRVSLDLIDHCRLSASAAIIDVGGGDSRLVDHLLDKGFTDLTVLDISEAAIQRAKNRLGTRAGQVHWIVSDILDFQPARQYDLWHDRAAFHFQTQDASIQSYLQKLEAARPSHLVIGGFSVDGPQKCSGLEVCRYDEQRLAERMSPLGYRVEECLREDHHTPAGAVQNFIFCRFSLA